MDEVRGLWIHDSTCRALGGAEVARLCSQFGMDILLPKAPWMTGSRADPDYWEGVMEPMIEEAHDLGMEVHAWIFFLNDASVDDDQSLLQVMEDGKTEKIACAANPETVRRNIEKIGPILESYDLDGLSLEDCFVYHRWPKDPMTCFCSFCQENAPQGKAERLAWNRNQLTELLRRIMEESRIYSADIQISAAARVPYETHGLPMSTDWKRWCELGLLDYIAPMIYKTDNKELEEVGRETLEILEHTEVPVYMGLGAYKIDRELKGHDLPQQLGQQIEITRDLGADGHILYHFGGLTVDQLAQIREAYA